MVEDELQKDFSDLEIEKAIDSGNDKHKIIEKTSDLMNERHKVSDDDEGIASYRGQRRQNL